MRKVVVAWVAVLALCGILAVSCSINNRSGAFECADTSDCDDGRVCSENLCVVPGGNMKDASVIIDAPKGDGGIDASLCPSQCTSCNTEKKECVINCAMTPSGCSGPVVCPPGWHCNVTCSPAGSCRMGVNCQGTLSCTVACSGQQACRNVQCGASKCLVSCTGEQSCRGVSCGMSCGCDVKCPNIAECSSVTCTSFVCRDQLTGGCSSTQSPSCNSCQM